MRQDREKGKGKDKQNNKKKGKGKEEAADGPGSKSSLAMSISNSELWIAGVVVNIEQVAKHYKVAQPDHMCWPVLLSKKKGDAALQICPDHSTHGDLKQAVHKRPANLNLDFIYKNFARAATIDENKSADWQPPKKKKA